MDCSVVQDLLPLYIDECCSAESVRLVEQHLNDCADCRRIAEEMKRSLTTEPDETLPSRNDPVMLWKASVLQSVLMLLSFAVITAGVALEAYTPQGLTNGFWAFTLVAPATGFMLSLTNWYFVRLYKTRRSFVRCSNVITVLITAATFVWCLGHYGFLPPIPDAAEFYLHVGIAGVAVSALLGLLAGVASNKYARFVGKD